MPPLPVIESDPVQRVDQRPPWHPPRRRTQYPEEHHPQVETLPAGHRQALQGTVRVPEDAAGTGAYGTDRIRSMGAVMRDFFDVVLVITLIAFAVAMGAVIVRTAPETPKPCG